MAPFIDDILHLMFSSYFDGESMVRCGYSVCKQWHNIIRSIPIDFSLEKYQLHRLVESSPDIHVRSLVLSQDIGKDLRERMRECSTFSKLETLVLNEVMDFSSMMKLISSPVMKNLTQVSFSGGHNKKEKLIACPEMRALKSLTLHGEADELLKSISEIEYFENLEVLDLDMASYSDVGIHALVSKTSHIKNLTILSCESSQLTGSAIRAIANSPNMKNLTKLNIGYSYKGVDAIKDMAESEYMKNLKILHVTDGVEHLVSANSQIKNLKKLKIMGTRLNEDIIKIANCPHMNQLEKLSRYFGTSTSNLEESGDTALAQSNYLTNLEKYYLEFQVGEPTMFITSPNASNLKSIYGCINTPNMAHAVAESLYLKNISRLHIYGELEGIFEILSKSNNLKEKLQSLSYRYTGDERMKSSCETITHLAEFRNLNKLDLANIEIGLDGMNLIISTGLVKHLRKLVLSECSINSDGIKSLSECQDLQLTSLSLKDNSLTGLMQILCQNPSLTSLQELDLKGCDLSDEDVSNLSHCKYLKNLRILNLRFNNLSNNSLKEILSSEYLKRLSVLDMFRSEISVDQELLEFFINSLARFTNLSFLSIPRKGKAYKNLEKELERFGIS